MKKLSSTLLIAIISILTIFITGDNTIFSKQATAASIYEKVKVITQNVKEENEWFTCNLNIPTLRGLRNKNVEVKINNLLKDHAVKVKEATEKAAKDAFENSKKFTGENPQKYSVYTSYKVRYSENDFFSLTVMYEVYTGGAHGIEIQKGYTFDLSSGKLMSFSDLFAEDFNYSEVITAEVLSQMKNSPQEYFPFDDSTFKKIGDDQQYYIQDGSIVIYYDEYEIAPYSSGIPEFRIPFSKLKFKKAP